MKVAIWGAAVRGEWFANCIIDKATNVNVVCFGDNNKKKIGLKIIERPILSLEEIAEKYKERQIERVIILANGEYLDEIVSQLLEVGIQEIFFVPEYLHLKELEGTELLQNIIKIDVNKPRLSYIEYQVADHCNLNCKGCGHFCPLVKEVSYGNLNQYISDLKRIKELCWGVRRIRLMGGEPLLNEELPIFIRETRKIFADATISVVSNGLLFPQASQELLDAMKSCRCQLDISLYKPTEKVIDKIYEVCRENEIECNVSSSIDEFQKSLSSIGKEDIRKSFQSCLSHSCHFLRDGKMAVCGIPILIDALNNEFSLKLEARDEDIIDIYDKNLTGWKLLEKLSKPTSMCRFCKAEAVHFKWTVSGKEISAADWLVD